MENAQPKQEKQVEQKAENDIQIEAPPAGQGQVINPRHKYWLVTLCHHRQNPHYDKPGFRIVAAFAEQSAISEYLQRHDISHMGNIYCVGAHEFVPIRVNATDQLDHVSNQKIIDELLKLHSQRLTREHKRFEENKANRQVGEMGASVDAQMNRMEINQQNNEQYQKDISTWQEEMKKLGRTNAAMSSNMLLLGQRYAVVIRLPDIRPNVIDGKQAPEPLFALLYVGDTPEACTQYISSLAEHVFQHCDFSIVQTGKYLYPQKSLLEVPITATDLHPEDQAIYNIINDDKTSNFGLPSQPPPRHQPPIISNKPLNIRDLP